MSFQNSNFAPEDSPYILQNPKNLPIDRLIKENLPLPEKLYHRSVAIPGTAAPGLSEIYRNQAFPTELKSTILPELSTYYHFFSYAAKAFADKPCFASRKFDYKTSKSADEFTSITFREVDNLKRRFGSGLLYLLKHNPYKDVSRFESHKKIDDHEINYKHYNKDDISFILTLFSANRAEWVLTDLMCGAFSITNTALYDTLGPTTSHYILKSTESPIIITSKNHISSLIKLKHENPEDLAHVISIISMDPLFKDDMKDQALIDAAKKQKIALFDLNQVVEVGKIFPHEELPPPVESLYTISFTSGTTGSNPKGVLIPQRMAAAGITFALSQLIQLEGGKAFSFLPLAHIFERQLCSFSLTSGGCVGFPQIGSTPLTLTEDLKLFRPHYMANVPRVYSKFEAAIKAGTIDSESAIKKAVFNKVFNTKRNMHEQEDGSTGSHLLYDTFILPNIRKFFGFHNMKFAITGSAPISPDTVKFLKASLNVGLVQGYGLTETFAGCSLSLPYEASPGSCGSIGIATEMRIREIPEMGYHLDDPDGPRGELLLRGPQVFPGYFKNEEETAKSIDEEGWFYSGDIALISKETGKFYIIDRVKNFFKLSQGEYVTPEKVETTYLSNNSILQQCYAHGDSLRSYLVSVIGVDPDGITQFLVDKCDVNKSLLTNPNQILEISNKRENRKKLLEFLNKNVSECRLLQGFEKLHNIYIEFEPLRLEREVITPTMKLRRPIAAKFFQKQINEMYEEGSLLKDSKL